MFSLASGVYQTYLAPQQLNLLLVGASGVGKTTFLERIKVTQLDVNKMPVTNRSSVTSRYDADLPTLPTLPADLLHGEPCPVGTWSKKEQQGGNSPPQQKQQQQERRNWVAGSPPASLPGRIVVNRRSGKAPKCPAAVSKDAADDGCTNAVTPPSPAATTQETTSPRRSLWVCPSPEKYRKAAVVESDDEEDVYSEQEQQQQQQEELVIVELHSNSSNGSDQNTSLTPHNEIKNNEYDLKPNAKMLPLHKIRPTCGMNLAKVDICGAKCHVWDLGGRLQDLWERYYDDCDAAIFVWRMPGAPFPQPEDDDDDRPDDEKNATNADNERLFLQKQERLLETVREAISPDVPFLVLAHYGDEDENHCDQPPRQRHHGQWAQTVYRTEPYVLPDYQNPFQAVCFANARTGQGVRSAMEWLIPLAKQQQRIRERSVAMMPATESNVANHAAAHRRQN